MDIISDIWPEQPTSDHLHIFVELPAGGSPTLVQTAVLMNPLPAAPSAPQMAPIVTNRTEFIMKLRRFERWPQLCESDLNHSNVRKARSSQFLQEFQERLGRRRYISNATEDLFRALVQCSTIPLTFLDSYFDRVGSPPAETDIPELDQVTVAESLHYSSVLCGSQMRNKAKYDEGKESQVHSLLLEFTGVEQLVPNVTGSELPFHLVVETNGQKTSYTPRSDFRLSIRDFPHIILEVNSEANGGDGFSMLLQAASITRIGNWLRASTSDKPIVIMAIYIDERFKAHQHILYQPDVWSIEVEYVSKVFDLTVPQADNACLHRPETRLAEAKESVAQKNYPTFTSKRRHEESRRNTVTKSKRDPDTSSEGGEEDSFGNPSVQREVTRAGYTLTQPISEEFTPLTPLKPSMRRATSRSGVLVVLKTIVDSDERRLLHYLNGIKAPSNHTIPLIDVIDLGIEKTIIVLPRKSPLDDVLPFRDWPDDIVSLCLQFIEGVAFLHEHNVAHCDLKPGNVVVDAKSQSKVSPRLFIIDRDLALSVESEETTTKGWCGTPPWIAPEIGSESGPIRRYSPILADRWACGRMIEYFAKYFPTYEAAQERRLRAFAKRLVDVNPRARPELNQQQAIHTPRKRKAAESQHESIPKRHAVASENDLLPLGSSFESPKVQAQYAILAPDKVETRCFPMGIMVA
ncbi:kinase-like domain-containing protein [Russula dissimulans]|nr:kinase-like domain-containing protein [Russula dissimulans]